MGGYFWCFHHGGSLQAINGRVAAAWSARGNQSSNKYSALVPDEGEEMVTRVVHRHSDDATCRCQAGKHGAVPSTCRPSNRRGALVVYKTRVSTLLLLFTFLFCLSGEKSFRRELSLPRL